MDNISIYYYNNGGLLGIARLDYYRVDDDVASAINRQLPPAEEGSFCVLEKLLEAHNRF